MTPEQRKQDVVLIEDFDGPEQQVSEVEIARADHDVYDGITAGTVVVLDRGESFIRTTRP